MHCYTDCGILKDIVLSVNFDATDSFVVSIQLSVMSEEMLNSATFEDEDEAVNDDSCGDAAAAADGEDIVLLLTVDDEPVYNSSPLIPHATLDSVLTESSAHVTECNMLEKILSGSRVSQQTLVAVAQAKVFRQYLLDGDVRVRILELDNTSVQKVCVYYV